jgi:hypothetical protein
MEFTQVVEQIIDECVWERFGGHEDEDWTIGYDILKRLWDGGYRVLRIEDLATVKQQIDTLAIAIGGNP